MEARLVVMNPRSAKWEVMRSILPATIGRGTAADVQVTDVWVSRLHCRIDQVDGELIVRDLGSRHGTMVNREYVSERVLSPSDEIAIGTTRLRVIMEDADVDCLAEAAAV